MVPKQIKPTLLTEQGVLSPSVWYNIDDLISRLDAPMLPDKNGNAVFRDNDFYYFVKIENGFARLTNTAKNERNIFDLGATQELEKIANDKCVYVGLL